jgi:hypothetical protein
MYLAFLSQCWQNIEMTFDILRAKAYEITFVDSEFWA